MEIDDEWQMGRRCFSRESMRKLTEPELERASPVSPLRLAPVRRPNRTSNDTFSGGAQLFTPLDKTQTRFVFGQRTLAFCACAGLRRRGPSTKEPARGRWLCQGCQQWLACHRLQCGSGPKKHHKEEAMYYQHSGKEFHSQASPLHHVQQTTCFVHLVCLSFTESWRADRARHSGCNVCWSAGALSPADGYREVGF
jgi:hypothetical protein